MKLGDTEQRTLAISTYYVTTPTVARAVCQGEPCNPSSLLTLKYAKRIRTRCANCRKVQLNEITKGDEHDAESV